MKELTVFLYGEPSNNAVLRLPDRKYPGVLIQGDTLKNLLEMSELVVKHARKQSDEELASEAEGLFESLRDIYEWYKKESSIS